MFYCLLLLSLLCIPCCRNSSISRELAALNVCTQKLTGCSVRPADTCQEALERADTSSPLSIQEATRLALMYNPDLQVSFSSLGIAKADLIQAGFFTNPSLSTLFNFPLKGNDVRNETSVLFSISDLWRVPLQKRVVADQMEIASLEVLKKVLETMILAHEQYYAILLYQAQVKSAQKLLKESRALKKELDYRQQFGLATDLDRSLLQVQVGLSAVALERNRAELKGAYITFRRTIGLEPSYEPLLLSIQLQEISFQEIDQKYLEHIALHNRPEVHIARMRVQQAEHKIQLEKARVFKDIKAGISFEREFDGASGIGPEISITLPLFDQNQAQIARARYELEQAVKTVQALESTVIAEVRQALVHFRALEKQLTIYKKTILHAAQQGLEYVNTFEPLMQITTVLLIQTRTAFYENIKKFIQTYSATLRSFVALERAVGASLISLLRREGQ